MALSVLKLHLSAQTGRTTMAKGQKKSNKEARKPKQEKPKTEPAGRAWATQPGKPPGK
jgi:hypothetical protein